MELHNGVAAGSCDGHLDNSDSNASIVICIRQHKLYSKNTAVVAGYVLLL